MIKPMYMPDICRGIEGDRKPLTESQRKTVDVFMSILKEDSFVHEMFRGWAPMTGGRKITVSGAPRA